LLRLDYVNLPARDPELLARWYAERFGLAARRGSAIGPGMLIVFERAGEPDRSANHFGLIAGSEDQVRHWAGVLGAQVQRDGSYVGFKSRDPEGNCFEIYWGKHGADAPVRVRPLVAEDAAHVRGILERRWGGVEIISRGRRHDASRLPGLLALDAGNEPCGLLTWRADGDQREVVSLDAFPGGVGTGSVLLRALEAEARTAGVRRMWLITTNDNVPAIAFYQRVGWRLYAVHRDALAEARRLKPLIPLTSPHGVPIRDEVELERILDE
jgi:GNAT superfamily N-acetyltransferase